MLKKTRTFMCTLFLLSNVISTPIQIIHAKEMTEDNLSIQEMGTITDETTEEVSSSIVEEGAVTVYTSEEFISALTNLDVHSIEFGADIITTEDVQIKVVGDHKNIKGNHFKWVLESDNSQTIDFQMRVENISNLEIINNSPLNMKLSYGGTIENLSGTNVTLNSLGTTNIYDSQYKGISIITEERVEILSSNIFSEGISIEDSRDILIDNTHVQASSHRDAIYLFHSGGIINNSVVNGGAVGIRSVGYASDLLVQDTIVTNSQNFGISNEPENGYSLIKINNILIEKSGNSSINNQQNYSGQAKIINLENSNLEIIDSPSVGIYLSKGVFENYGTVIHDGNQFTLAVDSLSYLYDPYNSFTFIKEANNTKFYNSNEKEGQEPVQETVEVADFPELQAALANEKISDISFIADIELPENIQLTLKGAMKTIKGNHHSLKNNHHQYIDANIPISLFDLNIESPNQSKVHLNLYKGGLVNNVKGSFTTVRSEGIISIQESSLEGISLHTADASEINHTEIGLEGINIYRTRNFSVNNTNISAAKERNGIDMTYSDGKLINVNIHSADIGIAFNGHSSELYIENTVVENTRSEGLSNRPVNSPSVVRLNGMTIKNTGKSNINNSQLYSGEAIIIVEEGSVLDLSSDDNIAVFQKKGYFENKGTIIHTGNHYTIASDYISTFVDYSDSFVKVAESSIYTYFNHINKEGEEFVQNSVLVDTVEQFIAALENPLVSNIELNNDLVFEDYLEVQVNGIDKGINGANYSLNFTNYAHFRFPYSASIENLSVENSSDTNTYLNFENGGVIDNLKSETTTLNGIGKMLISNSLLSQVSLRYADESLLESSTIIDKGFYVDESVNVNIYNSEITSTTGNDGIYYSHTNGEIVDTTIVGGDTGFRAYGDNNSILLDNVSILDSYNNGLWNTSQSDSSNLYLKDVYIRNAGEHAIYNNKNSRDATITVVEDSTLIIEDTNEAAVYQENAFFYNYGTIIADGNKYTILQDYYSVTEDYNNQLYLLNPNSNSYKNYVNRANYLDVTPPVAKLLGSETMMLELGEVYEESGIEAYDQFDGEIVDFITIGQVNTNEVGNYLLEYEVRDVAGNLARLRRNVIVQPKDISHLMLSGLFESYIIVGEPIVPEVSLHDGDKLLINKKDYQVSISNNNQVGKGTIIISGIGNYTGEVSYDFSIIPKVLESIEVQNYPFKDEYIVGQKIDLEGLVVVGTFNDGSKETLNVEMSNIKGFDSSKEVQGLTLSIQIEGHSAEFLIDILPREVEKIDIIQIPDKLEYVEGQKIDLSGLVTRATYNDGSVIEVDHSQVTIKGFNSSQAIQEQEITVTYEGKTDTFNVKILPLELQSLKIIDKPSKLTYIAGQSLDLSGLRIEGTYNDGSKTIMNNSDFSVTGFNSSLATEEQEVTLVYDEKSVSFIIEVLPLKLMNVEITTEPRKLEYIEGQPLDLSGLVTEGTYNDGSTIILENSQLSVSGFDSSKPTESQEVTLEFNGKTANFQVHVLPLKLVGLKIITYPQKALYNIYESLDLNGLQVQGSYNDGSKSIVDNSDLLVSGFNSTEVIENQVITVKKADVTTEFVISIQDNFSILYQTHVQSYGWQELKKDGEASGTEGESKRLEGIKINLEHLPFEGNVEYQTHVQSYGWMDWAENGAMSGTEGEAKRLEAIRIKLTGELAEKYDIYYRVHAESYGWLDWAKNGESAGTEGLAKRLEAIEIQLVKKGESAPGKTNRPYVISNATISYTTHVQKEGWQNYVKDGIMSGTEGKALRLEGIKMQISDPALWGGIQYRTHVQKEGWQNWQANDAMSGTEGKALRLEAIQIKLTGAIAEYYDVYYRVHAQIYGWLGWAKNGQFAGTEGLAKRLEGIEVMLVRKGERAPGSMNGAFVKK